MRELTYFVACSVDGFIAQQDGSHGGFAQDGEYIAALAAAFPETFPTHFRDALHIHGDNRWFDTVLMGRKTYEVGLKAGITSPYSHLQQVLFSRSMTHSPDTAVKLVSGDAAAFVQALKAEPGKGIWLCGGGSLAATLLAASLIDTLILKVNPFLMGAGIPLFAEAMPQTPLKLMEQTPYPNGVSVMHYRVGTPD